MTSRTRLWVLLISTPVIAFAVIGGYLGQVMAKDETYQHLRVFEDVVSLVLNNYVEEVDVKQAMRGAMRGLADGLDAEHLSEAVLAEARTLNGGELTDDVALLMLSWDPV